MKDIKIDLSNLGINNAEKVKRNLPVEMLVEEIVKNGEGVIGQQPILNISDSFEYTSFCPIKTEFGTMSGYYTFKEIDTNKLYKGIIPKFILVSPTQIN